MSSIQLWIFFSTSTPDMPFSSDISLARRLEQLICSRSFSSDFVPSNFGLKRLVNCLEQLFFSRSKRNETRTKNFKDRFERFDYLFVRVKNSAYLGEKKILKNFDPFRRLFQPVLFERLAHSFKQILLIYFQK